MSILPSFSTVVKSGTTTTTVSGTGLSEWGVNFDTGQLTGETVDGSEAVKCWIWKALMTQRFRWALYTWNYGSELESYIGRVLSDEYLKTDVKLALEDCLLINEEIKSITNYSAYVEGDVLYISFTAVTKYGPVSILDYEVTEYVSRAQKLVNRAMLAFQSNTIQFYITPATGRLYFKRYAGFDNVATFEINRSLQSGRLFCTSLEEFVETVDLEINTSNGQLEATYDV